MPVARGLFGESGDQDAADAETGITGKTRGFACARREAGRQCRVMHVIFSAAARLWLMHLSHYRYHELSATSTADASSQQDRAGSE